jgi:hypothetical protein
MKKGDSNMTTGRKTGWYSNGTVHSCNPAQSKASMMGEIESRPYPSRHTSNQQTKHIRVLTHRKREKSRVKLASREKQSYHTIQLNLGSTHNEGV